MLWLVFLQGKCQRKDPPCKYLHPPQHLKEQLLQNGRNNLIIRQLQMQALSQAIPPMGSMGSMGSPMAPMSQVVSTTYPSMHSAFSKTLHCGMSCIPQFFSVFAAGFLCLCFLPVLLCMALCQNAPSGFKQLTPLSLSTWLITILT